MDLKVVYSDTRRHQPMSARLKTSLRIDLQPHQVNQGVAGEMASRLDNAGIALLNQAGAHTDLITDAHEAVQKATSSTSPFVSKILGKGMRATFLATPNAVPVHLDGSPASMRDKWDSVMMQLNGLKTASRQQGAYINLEADREQILIHYLSAVLGELRSKASELQDLERSSAEDAQIALQNEQLHGEELARAHDAIALLRDPPRTTSLVPSASTVGVGAVVPVSPAAPALAATVQPPVQAAPVVDSALSTPSTTLD